MREILFSNDMTGLFSALLVFDILISNILLCVTFLVMPDFSIRFSNFFLEALFCISLFPAPVIMGAALFYEFQTNL